MLKKSHLGMGGLAIIGLLFIAIMLLANLLLRGAQVDLTADRLYTLSDGTKNIVSNLKEPLNLYLFISQEASASNHEAKNYGVRVRELLEELVSRSKGKLTLKVIDPKPFTEEEDRASELGVVSVPAGNFGEKRYLGLAATNSTDGKDAIPYLDPRLDDQLEYDVAKLIHKLATEKKPVVGWLSSIPMQGDFDPHTGRPGQPWVVYTQVEQLYTVRNLDSSLTKVDPDVDVLVIVHPKDLPPAALYAIDQFALRGGHVLAFVDPFAQSDRSGMDPNNPMSQFTADKSSSLEPLLAAWGIEYKPDQVVGDLERGLVVPMREGEPPSQHIGILGLDASSFSKDIITSHFDAINMLAAGALKPIAGSSLKFEPLIHTSKQAGLIPAQRFMMLSEPATLRDGFKPSGELALAARVSGTANSAFAGGPPPGVAAAPDALKASAKPLNVVVVADVDMLVDFTWVEQLNFFGQTVARPFANNGALVWNAVDNLAGSDDLVSIRARAPYSRPFDRVMDMRKNADAQLRVKQEQLQTELAQTEETINKLQLAQPAGNQSLLSADQARELDRFREQQLRIRKELRAVMAGVDSDIQSLGRWVKGINILLMPALVAGAGVLFWIWRRRRRQAIAMLNKGASA
jgi:ABC-type uncharacterized transport system involved in gliding motility auxiliary subunit